jgi:hypothetical protein
MLTIYEQPEQPTRTATACTWCGCLILEGFGHICPVLRSTSMPVRHVHLWPVRWTPAGTRS